MHASFSVTNTGDRSGADVPQLYMLAPGESRLRLLGFERVANPADSAGKDQADPRLLTRRRGQKLRIEPGGYGGGGRGVALKLAAKVKRPADEFGR